MAQPVAQNGVDRAGILDPIDLTIDACSTDDPSLVSQAICMATHPKYRRSVQYVLELGLRSAAAKGAVQVLQYVLAHGVDVGCLTASNIVYGNRKPSQAGLEILVAHGWDINTRGPGHTDTPLLWLVTKYHDLVVWCLAHGARIDIPEDQPKVTPHVGQITFSLPPTLLGMVVSNGSIETFELLRARGAPLDARILHRAVTRATLYAPSECSEGHSVWDEHHMKLVRHLVDIVKLDVNRVAYKIHCHRNVPLCFPAALHKEGQGWRELVHFLLDRGADPNLSGVVDDGTSSYRWPSPIECAEQCGNKCFLQIVQERQASHKSGDSAG